VDGAVVCFGAAGEAAEVVEDLLGLNQECLAGVGETAAGAGDVAAAGSFFLERLAGVDDSTAGAGDVAAVAAGAVSFFLERLGLATLAEGSGFAAGDGDWASNEVTVNPINVMSRPINLFIAQPYCRGQRSGNVKMARAGDDLPATTSLRILLLRAGRKHKLRNYGRIG
jgi:hypothetical protein